MTDTDDDIRFGYYLEDFRQVDPLPFSLRGWAAFLADRATRDGQRLQFNDGDLFKGYRVTFRYAPAIHGEDGWDIPEPPPGHVYAAVAYASGDGWDEDATGQTLAEILGVLLRCDTDGEQWIVFRQTTENALTFRFLADGPHLVIEAAE